MVELCLGTLSWQLGQSPTHLSSFPQEAWERGRLRREPAAEWCGLLDANLGGKAAFVLASPPKAFGPIHRIRKRDAWLLRNNQALTDPQLLRIIDAFLIRVEDFFPASWRFVELS